MNVSEALSQARAILRNRPSRSEAKQLMRPKGAIFQLEAEILLASVMRKEREFLMMHPEAKIAAVPFRKFQALTTRRRRGAPIAYLTGHKEFYGLDFCMEPGVFIPRPETELLVEKALSLLQTTNYKLQTILDVGTGSGCIAVTLAKHFPRAQITAVDISPKALKLAKKNAKIHSVAERIRFLKSDLLENVMVSLPNHGGEFPFDFIVANLPYIGINENNFVSKEVLDYEPAQALFGGATGLELFEKLFEQIAAMRRMPKWLIAEIGFSQKSALARLIKKHFGNVSVIWKNDLAGLPRIFTICTRN